MKLSLEQLAARMRQGETIPSRQTAQVALALSIPSILEQLVVTAMGYIDAAMVGHIGAEATASIGIVSSSTWLLHGVLVGLYTALSIQIAQYLGADRQDDARSVLRQAMLFNVILGVGAALFGLGISPFLPGWLGADPSLRANATAYFAIWSAALPFTMAMGMYASILRAAGNALTASLISVLVCVLDAIFNFFLINPTRTLWGITVWGAGLGVPGAALGTALATVVGGLLAFGPRSGVVTSGVEQETGRHVVWGYDHTSEAYFTLPYRFIQVHFPGTGDMFSAVLVGKLLAGMPMREAVQQSMDILERLIFLEQDEIEKNKGIRIEKFLSLLKE